MRKTTRNSLYAKLTTSQVIGLVNALVNHALRLNPSEAQNRVQPTFKRGKFRSGKFCCFCGSRAGSFWNQSALNKHVKVCQYKPPNLEIELENICEQCGHNYDKVRDFAHRLQWLMSNKTFGS